jgi:hypothetical protein
MRRRLDEKLDRFLTTLGRDPTPRERWRLEREAVVDSRPVKGAAEDAATLHDLWRHQLTALGWTPERLISTQPSMRSTSACRRLTGAVEQLDQTLQRGPDHHAGHDLGHGISM